MIVITMATFVTGETQGIDLIVVLLPFLAQLAMVVITMVVIAGKDGSWLH